MSAMKALHEEYGTVCYQADVENTIDRSVMFAKRDELLAKYGQQIAGMLDDIYDDVTDYPEQWEGYGMNPRLAESARVWIRLVKAVKSNSTVKLDALLVELPYLNNPHALTLAQDYVNAQSDITNEQLHNPVIRERMDAVHARIFSDEALSLEHKTMAILTINKQFVDLVARYYFEAFMDNYHGLVTK